MSARRKSRTNVQTLRALVALADKDVCVQLFIMDALHKLANACADANAKDLETTFFSGDTWKRAAVKVRDELNFNEGGKA